MEEIKKQEKKEMQLVQRSTSYKLIIPANVEAKIRFICNNVWNTEWSGTLFYTYKGSFKDDNLVITAEDIFVMDIGTTTYTEFDMSPDVISYMTEHTKLLDCQIGLVHSHNNMNTFFSGTDIVTLKEEGNDRNHFVSLIVNNAGKYTARITRKVKLIKDVRASISYETFNDEKAEDNVQYFENEEYLESFNLEIVKEDNTGFDEIKSQLEEIKKTKSSVKTAYNPTNPNRKFDKTIDTQYKDVPKFNKNGYNLYGYSEPPKYQQQQIPFEDLDETKMPNDEDKLHCSKETVASVALQLVTGSIVIPNSSNLDIEKWITSMPSIYEKRFGKGAEGLKMFQLWIPQLVEFLLMYTEDDIQIVCEDETVWSVLAQDLIDYYSDMPKNEYMKIIIDELTNFTM